MRQSFTSSLVIFNEQNSFLAAFDQFGRVAVKLVGAAGRGALRQVNVKSGSLSGPAVYQDGPIVLPDNTVHLRQAHARSPLALFGREKWLKDVRLDFFRYA